MRIGIVGGGMIGSTEWRSSATAARGARLPRVMLKTKPPGSAPLPVGWGQILNVKNGTKNWQRSPSGCPPRSGCWVLGVGYGGDKTGGGKAPQRSCRPDTRHPTPDTRIPPSPGHFQ